MPEHPAHDAHPSPPEARARRRVIVAGYGPVGRAVTQRLEQAGAAVTIIDLNGRAMEKQATLHKPVIHGDVREPTVLQAAGIAEADALVLTIPEEQHAVQACWVARRLNPAIYIAARTNFVSQGMLATEAGADHVVVEEVVTAEAMQGAVVQQLLDKRSSDAPRK